MTKTERLSAKAIMEIISKDTGERVGWLYEWNDGKQVPGWCDEPVKDVEYVPIRTANQLR